jgi:hypothetical protein
MSLYPDSAPTRFFVRLKGQQIALANGVTVIGRDPEAAITIVDDLVSRRHASVEVNGDRATIEDLESRNGTWLNGVPISGPHSLRDGDRITIGSWEFTIGMVGRESAGKVEAPVGALRICLHCRTAHPATLESCPSCGAASTAPDPNQQRYERTSPARWSLGMLIEMLGKSMLIERPRDTENLMRKAAIVVNQQLHDARALDPEELRALKEAAAWLAKAQGSNAWPDWIATIEQRAPIKSPAGA